MSTLIYSFNSPLQNKLIKIYDWEKNYKLQPTRSLIKYMRAIAKESAKNTTSSRGHSDSSGDYTYLLSGCPKSSELDYDFPEFFAFRDLAFYFKYWYALALRSPSGSPVLHHRGFASAVNFVVPVQGDRGNCNWPITWLRPPLYCQGAESQVSGCPSFAVPQSMLAC